VADVMFQMALMRKVDDGIVADASNLTERKRSKERRRDDSRDYPHKTKTFVVYYHCFIVSLLFPIL